MHQSLSRHSKELKTCTHRHIYTHTVNAVSPKRCGWKKKGQEGRKKKKATPRKTPAAAFRSFSSRLTSFNPPLPRFSRFSYSHCHEFTMNRHACNTTRERMCTKKTNSNVLSPFQFFFRFSSQSRQEEKMDCTFAACLEGLPFLLAAPFAPIERKTSAHASWVEWKLVSFRAASHAFTYLLHSRHTPMQFNAPACLKLPPGNIRKTNRKKERKENNV
mmetsp:Transcript_16977/g.34440  ORF Transcript_16977/g.34440 Transcript_16977/m.34440 type:complete len:217 (+) Transcript_16977:568-1218(+)